MYSLVDIFKRNVETYYDYRSGQRQKIWPRILFFIGFSFIFSVLSSADISGFLNSVITLQAILLGFSFSAMFFIASASGGATGTGLITDAPSIEESLRAEKIARVIRELFCNLSYFNVVAILCLATAILRLVPFAQRSYGDMFGFLNESVLLVLLKVIDSAFDLIDWLLKFGFAFSVLESAHSFMRILGRINFLFEKNIR